VNIHVAVFVVDHTQFLENMASAVSALENLLIKVKFLELRNLAGNKEEEKEWLMIQ